MPSYRSAVTRAVQLMVSLALAVLTLVVSAIPAMAHADLLSSDPAHGAVLSQPPTKIVLMFSAALQETGDEVEVRSNGDVLPGTTKVEADRVTFEPATPFRMGTFSLTWKAKTGDAHPRSGVVSFSVGVPAGAGSSTSLNLSMPMDHDMSTMTPPSAAAEEPAAAVDDRGWVAAQAVVKFGTLTGLLLAVGGLVFLAFVHHGHPGETRWISYLMRRSAGAVLGLTVFEIVIGTSWLAGGLTWPWDIAAYKNFLAPPTGVGYALRVAGIAMVLAAPLPPVGQHSARKVRTDLRSVLLAWAGVGLVALSVVFFGHSMTEATGAAGWIADSVHVLAAGAWGGGVVILALVLARRWARGEHLDGVELAIRFSPVAATGLVLLAVSGVTMSVMEVKAFGALGSTTFGRALVFKLLLVGVAAVIGGYNKYRLIPALDADDNPESHRRIVTTTKVEAIVMLSIIAATAFLIDAGQ